MVERLCADTTKARSVLGLDRCLHLATEPYPNHRLDGEQLWLLPS
jgi:hypothetical protein